MAEIDPTNTPRSVIPEAYNDPLYQQNRQAWFDIIGKSTMFEAIQRNSGLLLQGLITTLAAAVVTGLLTVNVTGGLILAGAALAVTAVNATASYMNERMSKSAVRNLDEASKIMEARINARENAVAMAEALTNTLGEEIASTHEEARQNAQAIDRMQQDMKHWQERMQAQAGIQQSQQIH